MKASCRICTSPHESVPSWDPLAKGLQEFHRLLGLFRRELLEIRGRNPGGQEQGILREPELLGVLCDERFRGHPSAELDIVMVLGRDGLAGHLPDLGDQVLLRQPQRDPLFPNELAERLGAHFSNLRICR